MKKWVILMADYSSSGLWHEDNSMMDLCDLPISSGLARRLEEWCGLYETSESSYRRQHHMLRFDTKSFSEEGSAVAFAIKDELPDWTVFYFNDALAEKYADGPRYMFEYEIGLDQTE